MGTIKVHITDRMTLEQYRAKVLSALADQLSRPVTPDDYTERGIAKAYANGKEPRDMATALWRIVAGLD